MTQKYERGTESNINPFTMVLKGVIDAAVNGGVFKYQDAFFVPEYTEENPDHLDRVIQLKQCLQEQVSPSPFCCNFIQFTINFPVQVSLLEKGLVVHSKICTQDMLSLHESLESMLLALIS